MQEVQGLAIYFEQLRTLRGVSRFFSGGIDAIFPSFGGQFNMEFYGTSENFVGGMVPCPPK